MSSTTLRRILALGALAGLVAGLPAAAAGKDGFIRFDGITGDGGDAGHPGWFASARIDVLGQGSSGASIPKGAGSGSFTLARDGAGFAALVRACLGRQRITTAEVSYGPERYELDGVSVEAVQVGTLGSGMGAATGPILVTIRYSSVRDARAGSRPVGVAKTGVAGAPLMAPAFLTPTPAAPR
jgi:hypothetical protein